MGARSRYKYKRFSAEGQHNLHTMAQPVPGSSSRDPVQRRLDFCAYAAGQAGLSHIPYDPNLPIQEGKQLRLPTELRRQIALIVAKQSMEGYIAFFQPKPIVVPTHLQSALALHFIARQDRWHNIGSRIRACNDVASESLNLDLSDDPLSFSEYDTREFYYQMPIYGHLKFECCYIPSRKVTIGSDLFVTSQFSRAIYDSWTWQLSEPFTICDMDDEPVTSRETGYVTEL